MKIMNESNSIFTELNPEDAASINGGYYYEVYPLSEPNHYLVSKFRDRNDANLWNIVVDNKGTIQDITDDEPTIQQGVQPKYPRRAARKAIIKVRAYLS